VLGASITTAPTSRRKRSLFEARDMVRTIMETVRSEKLSPFEGQGVRPERGLWIADLSDRIGPAVGRTNECRARATDTGAL
jgi:hypothetical protein